MNGLLIAGLMVIGQQLGPVEQVYTAEYGWTYGQKHLDGPYAGQYNVQQVQTQSFTGSVVDGGLQAIAYVRALAMATQNVLSHGIGGAPGIPAGYAEGIGYGPSGLPDTCVLPGQCVADAVARAANGLTYRVRFFR